MSRFDETNIPFVDEIFQSYPWHTVLVCDRDHKLQVSIDELVERVLITFPNFLSQLHLLIRREGFGFVNFGKVKFERFAQSIT
jgi:hypothetical protein